MAYRYEYKYALPTELLSEFQCFLKLHPELFREIYHPRDVNSIYLETEEFKKFNEHVEGTQHREKYRIRWYGDLTGRVEKPILEVKVKHNQMNDKRRYELQPFELTEEKPWSAVEPALKTIEPGKLDREIALAQRPVTLVRYHRRYYLSNDRKARITIDTDLQWYSAGIAGQRLKKEGAPPHVVIELKYDHDHAVDAGRVSSLLPPRHQRHSKYLSAVRAIYPW
ncbi:MAG: polyphosphate polymerase domain-containing protein [Limisphaerales bacterium]